MAGLDQIAQRQLDLGPAGYFRVEPEDPAGNQVVVKRGFLFAGAHRIYDRFTAGDQTSAGFASVSGAGFKRYDLVSIDATGAVQITQGTEVAVAAPTFNGAPGFTGGPDLPDQAIPVGYILITETGAVTVTFDDISPVAGVFYLSRDLDGYLIDKGLLGAAPTGANDVVTTLFSTETSGGGNTAKGVVTSAPGNYVILVNQNGDELKHTTVPSRIYGRITFAAGVWTLSYFYTSAAGVETAIAAIETETEGGAPTNLRLIGVAKVFSRNDPSRPLFDSTVYRLSDQLVGDIPSATTAEEGKVFAARVAGDKAGAVSKVQGASGAQGDFSGIHTINFSAAGVGQVTNPSPGVVNVSVTGAPGTPGTNGSNGTNGTPGGPGPGFSTYDGTKNGSRTGLTWDGNSHTDSFTVTFGFAPKMASAYIGQQDPTTNGVAFYITSITISGNDVTVNYSYKGSNVTDIGYCVQAAG